MNFESFAADSARIGLFIRRDAEFLGKLTRNTSGVRVSVAGYVAPKDREALRLLVELAARHGVPLYPYSRGFNWGFGARVPNHDACVLVDLSGLDRILEINRRYGYAVIEPGVTQKQLHERLMKDAPEWFFDVTGSSAQTSVLGNCLERGISYNSHRVNVVSDLEVVLGSGQIVHTGCGQFRANRMTNLYRHGLGASLEGLFFQSNFGIVTQATVSFSRRPECYDFVSIPVTSFEDVPPLVESLGGLLAEGVIQCIPHIFNRDRILPVIAPLWKEQMAARGRVLSDEEVERRLETLFPGEWFAVMGLGASRGNIKVARRKIRAAMPAGVQARILTTRKERWLDFLADRLPFVSERSLLFRALRPSRNLVRGIPTDETLQSIAWPLDKDKTRVGPEGLDALSAGFIYCAPFAPLSAENARKMVAITEKHAGRFGFEPAISLNLVDRRILEGVLSVHFDKRDLAQVERARLCVRAMHLDFLQEGFVPYRLDAESMDLMDLLDSDARPVLDEIKRVLDPSGVISPGRYLTTKDNPCSPSHPARRRSSAEAR